MAYLFLLLEPQEIKKKLAAGKSEIEEIKVDW
jgi:hypothetical protein